jgi:hypothetical protein
VEDAGIPKRNGKLVRLGEKAFAALQVFQSQALHILGKQGKLTKAVVRMAMEGANEGLVLEVARQFPKRTAIERDSKLAPGVIPTPELRSQSFK